MSRTKTVFKWFTIFQHDQERDFLSEMHRSGWKLTEISCLGFYRFVECEPEEVVYRLDYNQEGILHKKEYVQMFSDCGWEYLFDLCGYSYFRKPVSEMQGEEEIFCDAESRLDMMKRVYKGRMLPLLIGFFCLIIPQLVMQILGYGDGSPAQAGLMLVFGILFFLYLCLFLAFGIQFYKYKKKVERKC